MRFMPIVNINYYRKFVKRNLPGLASMKGREPVKDVQSKPPSFMNARVENCPKEKAVTHQGKGKNESRNCDI